MTDRIDILTRIANLRELADKSTSQAEAMNAVKIAGKLMASYRVTEAELALEEGLGNIKVDVVTDLKWSVGLTVGERTRHKVQSVLWDIQSYCEVRVVLKNNYLNGSGLHVTGDKPDVELFWYLFEMIRDALDDSYTSWKHTQQGVGRGAKATFQIAMADAIGRRLNTMRHERAMERKTAEAEAAKALNKPVEDVRMAVNNGDLRMLNSNVSLIVASAAEAKRKAVNAAYTAAHKGSRLSTASGFGYRNTGNNAGAAGRSAGNSLNLGRPIGGASKKRIN